MPFVRFDRFEIVRTLGKGGFGTVYEAIDRVSSARVALKALHDAEGSPLLRFKEEFRIFSRYSVDHRNLVTLYDLFERDRQWFFTMELVRGVSLTDFTRAPGATGPESSNQLSGDTAIRRSFAQLAHALHSIHALGLVHCDIKPSNVLVTAEGRVVVLDFGLASERPLGFGADDSRDRSVSAIFGTPAYMAPEQCRTRAVTPATDWYSYGSVLYEALTGQRPFDGEFLAILEAKQWEAPRDPREIAPDAPRDLCELALRLLDADPGSRPTYDEVIACVRPESSSSSRLRRAPESLSLFVGREAELGRLQRALDASQRGTVIALVSAPSGTGKSALLDEFLERAQDADPDVLTFEGRCYERESMPHKAIDPVLDAVARHWIKLPQADAARLVPRDAGLLARMFPVLAQVREVQRATLRTTAQIDSFTLRHRAAEALRDFFHRVGSPLILTIDDAQWGDTDSASILEQVLRQPEGPPLLLVVSSRTEGITEGSFVDRLRALGTKPLGPRLVDIQLGPLSTEETVELASTLTGYAVSDSRISAIAKESGGNAFFIHELARYAPDSVASVEAVVMKRLQTLPPTALRFVTAAALSAQPIPSHIARLAAGFEPDEAEPFNLLRASRLIRTRAGADESAFEVYHDRFREILAAMLSDEEAVDWHRRLARAWETSPQARPETLATHYLYAGDETEARRYAEIAAGKAADALAFDRAANFYELLVRLEPDRTMRLVWHAKQGEALANAGRGYEAADAFLQAMDEPSTDRSIRLEGQAAAELIRAGYLEEANAVLARVLPKIGVRVPSGNLSALVTLLTYRLLLALRGRRPPARTALAADDAALRRIDVLFAVSEPLCFMSLTQGQALFTQAVWHALRAGEPRRAFRAVTGWAASLTQGTRAARASERLMTSARASAEADADAWSRARLLLSDGIFLRNTGQFLRAVERLESALELFSECRGVHWEVTTAQTIVHDSLLWMGKWQQMSSELPKRLQAAEQRGDIYLAAYANLRTRPVLLMAAGQLESAHNDLTDGTKRWAKKEMRLQRRSALCTRIELHLYEGEATRAHELLAEAWRGLRIILLSYQFGRVEMTFYRARIALARARKEKGAVDLAARDGRRLSNEEADWASALGALVAASVALEREGPTQAIEALKLAEHALRMSNLLHYAAAALYRRGTLTSGEKGAELVRSAEEWMKAQGVVDVGAMCNVLAPGVW